MQTTQGRMLDSLKAVQGFLDEHAATLADVATGAARKRLDDVITELAAHVAEQSGSDLAAQGNTKKQSALRIALYRDHLAPISRIARADLPDTPEIQPLKLPRGRPSVQKLASIARGMAKAAAPYIPVFVLGGLPADFIARLDAATNALLQVAADRSRNRGRRGGATTGLKTRLSAGRKIVRVLDALVKSAGANDPVLLADWNIVKRVQRLGEPANGRALEWRPGASSSRPRRRHDVISLTPARADGLGCSSPSRIFDHTGGKRRLLVPPISSGG